MRAYWEKQRGSLWLLGLAAFLIHGTKWNNSMIGLDTELMIYTKESFYAGWLELGRQGLVFLKTILGTLQFNPYFTGLMTLIFLVLAAASFCFLWDQISGWGENEAGSPGILFWGVFGILWISHPVMTEQLYFSLQSMEICLGILITMLSVFCIYRWQREDCRKKLWLPAVSVLLLLISFSCYQSFVELFIFAAVTAVLLQGLEKIRRPEGKTVTGRELLKSVVPYLTVFLIAFLGNTFLTGLFTKDSAYLKGQIAWGQYDGWKVISSIGAQVVKMWTGYHDPHYHFSFGILTVFTVILVWREIRRRKVRRDCRCVLLFFLFALLTTPYLLLVVCGGSLAVRSRLVLPAMTGFMAYLDLHLCLQRREDAAFAEKEAEIKKTKQVTAALLAVICLLGIWRQVQVTMAFYYTEQVCYEQDKALGQELIVRLEQVREREEYPVVIIGSRSFVGNNACLEGETIGRSFFEHDVEVEPRFYWSSRRVLGLLHILGADYELVEKEDVAEAAEYSKYMPEWPAENSVQLYEGMLIVKLSDFEG